MYRISYKPFISSGKFSLEAFEECWIILIQWGDIVRIMQFSAEKG
jgi:hypothetical protein